MYLCSWITLLYTWNIINQLYFNKKLKEKKRTRERAMGRLGPVWALLWMDRQGAVMLLVQKCQSISYSVVRPHGLKPARLLCPWDSPGKYTGVGCHFLLQRIFPTQLINKVVIVPGGQWRDSVIHIHVSILPATPLSSRLPHNAEQSSLWYSVGSCWLSILNTAVCTCPSQTPWLSLPYTLPPWQP